ncbi:MAG: copper-binding protein [Acidobacteria bacterium]|nr:copper-binding protein [Acidobacteriota bacterium]
MAAMTTAFPVAAEVSLKTVQTGEAVRFEIEMLDGGAYQIFRVAQSEGGPLP